MEALLPYLALFVVSFCFYMDNTKLRKTISANRGLSDQSLLAAQQALNEMRSSMYSHSDAIHKTLAQQTSDLGRTCGQEDGKLHNIAVTTTEEIEALKAAMANQVDAQFNALEDIKANESETRAWLVTLKRDLAQLDHHIAVESKRKSRKALKKSRK